MARNTYEIDENLEAPFDAEKLKRIGKYVAPYKGTIVLILFLMASSSILTMFIPIIFMEAVDVSIPNKDMQEVIRLSIYILAISLYVSIVLKIRSRVMTKMGQNIIFEIRKDIFEHVQRLPFTYFDNRPHGKIQVRIVNYVNNLSDLLSTGLVNVLTEIGSLFFIVCFMLYVNVRFTILCMLGLPILSGLIWYIQSRQRKAWQEASNKQSNLNAYISESINGVRITQSFVREKENRQIFNRLSNNYRDSWMSAVRYNFLLGPAIENISAITTAIIYVLSVYWVSGGSETITAGVVIAFISYIGRFWAPINTIASFYNSILTSLSYLERIFETMDEPIDVKDREDAIEMPEIKGEVKFENVCFAYEEGQNILNGISFKANVGESFAIVGPTGAGKTTIVNLLSRFYNINSGHIYIDNIDIESVTIKSLRTQMGVMMQESFIFSGTIMDNIRYGNQDATDEQVIEAAKIVCAHDFIMDMEDGYNTKVKERGSGLSAGQKQLISFARALLANPKILILDEATSSIDTETEIALQEGLKGLLKNRTSFIIAHRLSTIKNSTCILYVDKGQIVEKGSHEELIAKKGAYYKLYMSQYEFLKKEDKNTKSID
nr:ABC transporter ATP-binding protein [uncultured Tyzzerella sp.]